MLLTQNERQQICHLFRNDFAPHKETIGVDMLNALYTQLIQTPALAPTLQLNGRFDADAPTDRFAGFVFDEGRAALNLFEVTGHFDKRVHDSSIIEIEGEFVLNYAYAAVLLKETPEELDATSIDWDLYPEGVESDVNFLSDWHIVVVPRT